MKPINRSSSIEVSALVADEFAADISGVQVAALSDDDFDVLYNVWLEYGVVRLRKQSLNDRQLVDFSRRFGELDVAPPNEVQRQSVGDFPEILVVSNIRENGEAIGVLGSAEALWHTDMSYIEMPPKASLLYAIETPDHGGETSFLDMHHACERLDSDTLERISSMHIKHDGSTNSAGYLRLGSVDSDDPRETAGHIHPVVIDHPETGRKALYLGRRHRAWIADMALDQSEAELDRLWHQTLDNARIWTQHWMPGDLVIWDNRAVMHQRNPFDDQARRRMHRTQVRGESVPIGAKHSDA